MEIKILNENEIKLPKTIILNYDELSSEISEKLKLYDSDRDIDYNLAKEDRAKLNKLINAISDERKSIKNFLLAPMENVDESNQSFNSKIKTIISKIEVTRDHIDAKIKQYEIDIKNKRKEEVLKIALSKLDKLVNRSVKDEYTKCISFMNKFINDRIEAKTGSWLNLSTSKSTIEEEIEKKYDECVVAVNDSLSYMKSVNLDCDSFAMAKMWSILVETYNISDVIDFVRKYQKDQKLKESIEKNEKEKVIEEPVNKKESTNEEMDVYTCTIKFKGTLKAFNELKQYLSINRMEYETVSQMIPA